jgi:hypothetical protein
MAAALADVPVEEEVLSKKMMVDFNALMWVKGKQLLEDRGDWRIYRPSGGSSFECHNECYPDVDDTVVGVVVFSKDYEAAFDVKNDKLLLNRIPFSDMDSLWDPSIPDIIGRVLEAFSLFQVSAAHAERNDDCGRGSHSIAHFYFLVRFANSVSAVADRCGMSCLASQRTIPNSN